MSLLNVFNISGSALQAQTTRLNTTASNLANVNSASSSIEQTYKARHPIFAPILQEFEDEQAGVGVQVEAVVESQVPARREYNPGHPLADAEGFVFMPNVNPVEEMANMISASRNYQTNVEVMNSAKQMMMRTISLGQ